MKKNVLVLWVFFVGLSFAKGQVQVVQMPSSGFHYPVENVWNVNLINPFQKSISTRATAVILLQGRRIVELESTPFVIEKGVNNLSPLTLGTKKINFLDGDIREIVEITNSLPEGSYTVCLKFYCLRSDCHGITETVFHNSSDACMTISVQPPTPLLLAYPEDEAKLKITRPVLTWIPPMPIAMSSNLTYKLTLTEKRQEQSKIDAIKRNRPLLQQDGISLTTLSYPVEMEELEAGKHYAWQVEAWVGRTKVGTSEVWEFEIEEDSFHYEVVPKNQSYIDF